MLALREAALGLLLGASLGPALALAQTPARPSAASPTPPPAQGSPPASPKPATQAAPKPPTQGSPQAAPQPPAGAPATGNGAPPAANGAAAADPPAVASTTAQVASAVSPGSVGGQLLLLRGGIPKHGVVYLENAPAGSWNLPKERPAVALRGFRFQPEFVVVPVGQTVQFSNVDKLMHSPFSISPTKSFDLGRHAGAEVHSLTFDRPGVVDLFCNIHDTMQGILVVVPSTFYAQPAPDGSFQIGSVPPGRYRLVGYSPEAEQTVQPIEVRSRERTVVKLQLAPVGQPALGREKQK